ncbi:MAG: CARDB domain-containing protein [Candidatus Margulisiibacteriota bacterium]
MENKIRTAWFVLAVSIFAIAIPLFAASSSKKPLPDLAVTSIKITSSEVSGKVVIAFTVTNKGDKASPSSKTQIVLDEHDPNVIATRNAPSLLPGRTYADRVEYTVSKNNKYVFKATADYNNRVPEGNDLNNSNTVSFSFGRSF